MGGNTNQIKSGLSAVILGLCAKQKSALPPYPPAHKGRTEFHLPLPSVGAEKHLGKQTWWKLIHVHVPCPDIFQDQEKDKCCCKWNKLLTVLNSIELQVYTQWGPFSTQHESLSRVLCSPLSRFTFPSLWLSSGGWGMDHLKHNNSRAHGYCWAPGHPFRHFPEHKRLPCKATKSHFHRGSRRGCQPGSFSPVPHGTALSSWVMQGARRSGWFP